MKFRARITCPTCRRKASAFYDSDFGSYVRTYTHRVEDKLQPGQKPTRCAGVGQYVEITGTPVKASDGETPVRAGDDVAPLTVTQVVEELQRIGRTIAFPRRQPVSA